uniref:Nodulin-like domain-containing protein n=1 Tax=Arundo donax TaxID=35708 RepID=A0A0A9CZA1_ARUDO
MARVRGRHVAAIHGRDRVPFRRHIAGGQGRPGVQPAAGGGARRAKNLGDCVGFLAGALSATVPAWGLLLIGAAHIFLGYGWLWLVVTRQASALPLWTMCVLLFVGTNYSTYFNTASLVTCINNFPKNRGPTVGILKAFSGLSSAILTQIYVVMHTPDHAKLVFMIAVGPSLVAIGVMFVIRPVGGHWQERPSDRNSFIFIYAICLLLTSYLVGVMLVQDFLQLSDNVAVFLTVVLFILLVSPVVIPVVLTLLPKTENPTEDALLSEPLVGEASTSQEKHDQPEVILNEVEEKPKDIDSLPPSESMKWIAEWQAKLVQVAGTRGVRIRRPHWGENFTLMQALVKADFWLILLSLLLGAGSGLTVMTIWVR